MNTEHKGSGDESTRKVALSKRLEDFGWAVLLIAIGTIWLMPEKLIPQGSWLVAAGLIMLGLNAIRYFNGIEMVRFSLVAGILALLAGLGDFFGLTLPLFAIALIVIGVVILLKPLLEKDSISPATQGWCCCGQGGESTQDRCAGTSGRALIKPASGSLAIRLRLADEQTALIAFERAGVFQSRLYLPSSTMQAHLDGSQGKLEEAGNLISSKPINIVKQQHCLVRIGQIGNVPLHALTHLVLLDDGERRWPISVSNR